MPDQPGESPESGWPCEARPGRALPPARRLPPEARVTPRSRPVPPPPTERSLCLAHSLSALRLGSGLGLAAPPASEPACWYTRQSPWKLVWCKRTPGRSYHLGRTTREPLEARPRESPRTYTRCYP